MCKIFTPPEDRCFKDETTNGCSRGGGRNAWFTNFTRVPEVTIPREFIDGGIKGDDVIGYNPWTSPGAAPTHGNGCGVNGGNPDGCDGEGGFKISYTSLLGKSIL